MASLAELREDADFACIPLYEGSDEGPHIVGFKVLLG